jgi:hypothetical protein
MDTAIGVGEWEGGGACKDDQGHLSRATGKLVLITIQSVVASLSGPFGAGALSKMHRLKETLPDETQKKFVNWLD